MNFTYKQIWLINYPVMMSVLVEQLINITDAIFLGHVGEVELGASAIAGMYYMAIYILGFGFSLGIQVMVGRKNGEKNYEDTGKVFFQGLYFLIFMALFLLGLSRLLTPYILQSLLTSEEVYHAVIDYINWRTPGLLFAFPALAFRAFFVGIIRTRVLTVNAIILAVTNVALNYLFVFGIGNIPALGITGAAIASSLAELGGLTVYMIYMMYNIRKRQYGLSPVYDRQTLIQLFRLSAWSMLHSFISVAPWFLFFIVIEHLGQTQLAIANIVRSVSTLFFVIVTSFSSTTNSLVSNLIGAGEKEKIMTLCGKIIRLSYIVGIPLIFLVFIFSDTVLGIYTPNKLLIDEAFWPFTVMLSNYFLSVPAHVYCNAVSGTGNTRIAFIFQVFTIIFYLLYLYLINQCLNAPLAIYWTSEQFYVLIMFLYSWCYLKRGKKYLLLKGRCLP